MSPLSQLAIYVLFLCLCVCWPALPLAVYGMVQITAYYSWYISDVCSEGVVSLLTPPTECIS